MERQKRNFSFNEILDFTFQYKTSENVSQWTRCETLGDIFGVDVCDFFVQVGASARLETWSSTRRMYKALYLVTAARFR